MEPVGLAFASLAVADLCIKSGRRLVRKYKDYKTADTSISELILRIESCWLKTEVQVEFLQSNWNALGQSLQEHQTQILNVLQEKLLLAECDLDKLAPFEDEEKGESKRTGFQRVRFAVSLKGSLEKTVASIESWRERFDPSWWLILRLESPVIDHKLATTSSGNETLTVLKELRGEIAAQEANGESNTFQFVDDRILSDDRETIDGSQATLAYVKDTGHYMVVDSISCGSDADLVLARQIMKDTQDLARVLSNMNPSRFGLLSCFGAVKHQKPEESLPTAYDLLLRTPSGMANPQSMREVLTHSSNISLNERVELAVSLAKAVLFLHAFHFVHKSIRPENILLFNHDDGRVGKPFLIGFEKFRMDSTKTQRYGDDLWEKNLYRHPQRQGKRPQEDFVMQHDVYSLGVVLLELGLGACFVHWPKGTTIERPSPEAQLEIKDLIATNPKYGVAVTTKKKLVSLATTRLPSAAGSKYTEVVLACLTCLDRDNGRFGNIDDLQDNNGILVGVKFVEKILSSLEDISV